MFKIVGDISFSLFILLDRLVCYIDDIGRIQNIELYFETEIGWANQIKLLVIKTLNPSYVI